MSKLEEQKALPRRQLFKLKNGDIVPGVEPVKLPKFKRKAKKAKGKR